MIAPPTFFIKNSENMYYLNTPQIPGFYVYDAGVRFDYSSNRVIRPGDELHVIFKYHGLEDKSTPGKPYRMFRVESSATYYNQRDELVGVCVQTALCPGTPPGVPDTMTENIYKGRSTPRPLSDEELQKLQTFYEAELAGETRKGAEVRYWESVNVGDEVSPIIEGPLTIMDTVSFWHGCFGAFAAGWPIRKSQLNRGLKDPSTGLPEGGVIWHFSDDCARAAGAPRAIAIGAQTQASLGHLLCNWKGDDGWVKRMNLRNRAPRLFGEAAEASGKVVKKYIDDDCETVVDLEIWIGQPGGVMYTDGTATVRLLSRKK
jgi:acyl dehydratase